MEEISRILIEEYCREHPKTKKCAFLWKMVQMSYDLASEPGDWEAIQLDRYIAQEKNPKLKEALEDLEDFLFI